MNKIRVIVRIDVKNECAIKGIHLERSGWGMKTETHCVKRWD